MTRKGSSSRRRDIPVDYIVSDPEGNRKSRRMAAKEARARARGRNVGASGGGSPQSNLLRVEVREEGAG